MDQIAELVLTHDLDWTTVEGMLECAVDEENAASTGRSDQSISSRGRSERRKGRRSKTSREKGLHPVMIMVSGAEKVHEQRNTCVLGALFFDTKWHM